MADAIQMLIDEHRLIESVLAALDSFAEKLGQEPEEIPDQCP